MGHKRPSKEQRCIAINTAPGIHKQCYNYKKKGSRFCYKHQPNRSIDAAIKRLQDKLH